MNPVFPSPQMFTMRDIATIAQQIVAALHGGDVVLLSGELGAGKTTLAKAIAAALGVRETITSPTFTLMNIYGTKHPEITTLMHMDTYRMDRVEELHEIGVETYLGEPHTVCIVEWPERFPDAWHAARTQHWLTVTGSGDTRTIHSTTTTA